MSEMQHQPAKVFRKITIRNSLRKGFPPAAPSPIGCTPNDLCGWQEREASCGRPLTAEEARLMGSFHECTALERSAIVNMAETMADGGMSKNGGLREGRGAV